MATPAANGPGPVKLVGPSSATVGTVSPWMTVEVGAEPDDEQPAAIRANAMRMGAHNAPSDPRVRKVHRRWAG